MKITNVEIWDVRAEWNPAWNPVIIRVNTDEGISGVGEVGLAYGTGHTAGAGMAKNIAETFLIGADPLKSEKMWETLFRSTFWGLGGGPVVYGGMSAVDIALWDIRGKALGKPIYELLGGKTNKRLRTYASQLQFGWQLTPKTAITPKDYAEETDKALAQGYTAVKVNPMMFDDRGGFYAWDMTKIIAPERMRLIYNRMKAVREAAGPDVDIILETHSQPSATTAVQIGRALEEFNITYFEEPVNPLNVEAMAEVARNVRIPLASGERIYTRWGFRPFFEKQALGVIQPDLCNCGGITEGKKICDYAGVYDVVVQCHVCGAPVATAAALHLEAVIPNFIIHEHVVEASKPGNRGLIRQDLQPKNGYLEVPEGPGLGIELDDEFMSRYQRVKVG